jgi:integrase/recombinase XerC
VDSKTEFVVVDYLEQFLAWLAEQDRSPRTIRSYSIGVRDFSAWFEQATGNPLTPAMITPLDVKAWRQHLVDERRLASSTVNNYLAGLRSFCGWAVKVDLAEHDPTGGVKGLKQVEEAPRWLSRPDQFKLLRVCEQQVQLGDVRTGGDLTEPGSIWSRRDRAIVVLMLNAGLRLSEVAALRLDDLTIRPRSGYVTIRQGKGRKTRQVQLNADVRKALQEWLDVRPQAKSQAVFLSQKGGRLRARSIASRVTTLGEQAGLEITPHMLRHSLAKNLVDAGVSLDRVAKALGHTNLDTTKRYTTPSQADMQAEMEKVSWAD